VINRIDNALYAAKTYGEMVVYGLVAAAAIVLALFAAPSLAQDKPQSLTPALSQTAQAPFGDVAHQVVRVDGVRFHYVTAGAGEPVVLIPG
jgi:hypothetical protein